MKLSPEIPRRIVVMLIASMVSMSLPAKATGEDTTPRLLLNVLVEGLDATQLEMLRDYFGSDGFNRLMNQSIILTGDYGTPVDQSAAAAMFTTGASPSVSGITGALRFDRTARRLESVYDDGTTLGNFTNATYSPVAMLVSNLSDEARIAGGGVTQTYAIAPDPETAISLGGHSANAAIWIDNRNGNWATTTFYTDPPQLLGSRNRLSHLHTRLDTLSWTPLKSSDQYPGLPEHQTHYPFRYTLGRSNPNRIAELKLTPALINAEVTSFAVDLINDLHLGQHDGVDVINIAYTLAPYSLSKNPDTRFELIDSYYRLDSDLARLFKAAESQAGTNKIMFVMVGTPAAGRNRRDDPRWQIPYGEFSTRKAMSLLNVYLIALHGNGEWVSAYADGWLYLNDQLINERNIDAAQLRVEAAEFLSRMAGIKEILTSDDIRLGRGGVNSEALLRNTHHSTRGDLMLEILPGWQLIDDANGATASTDRPIVQREVSSAVPVLIMTPQISARTIHNPVDIRTIAPTICRLLRIRSPNAASLPALNF